MKNCPYCSHPITFLEYVGMRKKYDKAYQTLSAACPRCKEPLRCIRDRKVIRKHAWNILLLCFLWIPLVLLMERGTIDFGPGPWPEIWFAGITFALLAFFLFTVPFYLGTEYDRE